MQKMEQVVSQSPSLFKMLDTQEFQEEIVPCHLMASSILTTFLKHQTRIFIQMMT